MENKTTRQTHTILLNMSLPIILGLTLTMPYLANAEEAEESDRQIEEIVVTAERQEASIQDTSISITALTGDHLEAFGIQDQEAFQNVVPALLILPYDSAIRGVGRNFRSLGGDPGISTYVNNVYSEDLYSATMTTFWDIARIEVLRGPQGTLYGRNAIGGAVNFLYKRPSHEYDYKLKTAIGNRQAQEYYGAITGSLIEDVLSSRFTFTNRERDGYVKDMGGGPNLDSRGDRSMALQLNWTPNEKLEFNTRGSIIDINRVMGGADSGGLIMFRGESPDGNSRDFSSPYLHYRPVNPNQTNPLASDFVSSSQPVLTFTNPTTGANVLAQRVRPGIDSIADFPRPFGGYGHTGDPNACLFLDKGNIKGEDLCADTNGANLEDFQQDAWQTDVTWDVSDNVSIKYIAGHTSYLYQRNIDQDSTSNSTSDSHFYVNHEVTNSSHELQVFYDVSPEFTLTTGVFYYDSEIDQRGDLFSLVGQQQFLLGNEGGVNIIANNLPAALFPTLQAFGVNVHPSQPGLFDAKNLFFQTNTGNSPETFSIIGIEGADPGGVDIFNGIDTPGSHTLYATQTRREAYAAYAQAAWNMSDRLTLTFGARWARDDLYGEENLLIANSFENTALGAVLPFVLGPACGVPNPVQAGITGVLGTCFQIPNPIPPQSPFHDPSSATVNSLAAYNVLRGALHPITLEPTGLNYVLPGVAISTSAFRSDERSDSKVTWRLNLDWDIDDSQMMYFSVTSGYRGGGYNLVFFSGTRTYDPEELIAYEVGYKSHLLDNTLQLNSAVYVYNYSNIHTFGTEVGELGGTTTSVLEAPGALISGLEVEMLWLATDRVTLGGNYSHTPSEYDETLLIRDGADIRYPETVIPASDSNLDIKGNQVVNVPENKASAFASYSVPALSGGLELMASASWIDEVYFSQFQTNFDRAPGYKRIDLRATWTSPNEHWVMSGFVNNLLDEIGIRQIERGSESAGFVRKGQVTEPRRYGLEMTYSFTP